VSTFVYVKRNRLHPYTYPKEDVIYIEFQYVSMGTAYNMIHSKQVGWERAKKGEYEKWLKLRKEIKH
jgi:hypothetical protein